jgi:hypothetical protein
MTIENLEVADIDSTLHPDILAVVASHKGAWLALYNKLLREQRNHHAAWLLSSTSRRINSIYSILCNPALWHGGSTMNPRCIGYA